MYKKVIEYFQTSIKNLRGCGKNKTLLIASILVCVGAILFLLFPDLGILIVHVAIVIFLILIWVVLFWYPSIKENISQNIIALLVGMVLGASVGVCLYYLVDSIKCLTRDFYEGATIVIASITVVMSFIL